VLSLSGICLSADDFVDDEKLPVDLKKLIESDTNVLDFGSADLNGDGLEDYVFVVEKRKKQPDDSNTQDTEDEDSYQNRTLKLALRDPGGGLKIVKTNNKVVYCSKCGGVKGDPFEGIIATTRSFEITNSGGAWQRWTHAFKFNYSRIDK